MKRRTMTMLGALGLLAAGCGDTAGGVAPSQASIPAAQRAAELAKPDPNATPEQNAAKAQAAQDALRRNEHYSKRYSANASAR